METIETNGIIPTWDYEPTLPVREHANKSIEPSGTKGALVKTEKRVAQNKSNPRARAKVYEETGAPADREPTPDYFAAPARNEAQQAQPRLKEAQPAGSSRAIRRAYRYIMFAALGLVFSGLGALVFAPLAARYAFQALDEERTTAGQVRARVLAGLAFALFGVGLAPVYLLWLRIAG